MTKLQDENGEIYVCALCEREIEVDDYISLSLIRQSINIEKNEAEIHEWEDLIYFCGKCKDLPEIGDIILSYFVEPHEHEHEQEHEHEH